MAADKILTFMESLEGGGVERVALRLASLWAAAGREVTIVAGCLRGPLVVEVPSGVDVIECGSGRYGPLAIGLVRAVRERRPDILFCPGNYYSAIAVAARLLLGADCPPIVCKISNAFNRPDFNPMQQAAYTAWLRLHANWIDHFVAMTDAMRREAISVARVRPECVTVIPNPAPLPPASLSPPEMEWPGAPIVLGVGRLYPQKRFHKLVEAFARANRPDARLVILGEGPERRRIEDAAARFGVSNAFSLPGYVAEPRAWMAHAHVTALSSVFEGAPNVLRESLSVGTPVVSTACSSAVGEIVTSPMLGSIVPIDDVSALAEAIVARLNASPDRAAIRGAANQSCAEASDRLYLELMDRLRDRKGR
jgi:glycosyltransferase involved in cell wall biosynthesis